MMWTRFARRSTAAASSATGEDYSGLVGSRERKDAHIGCGRDDRAGCRARSTSRAVVSFDPAIGRAACCAQLQMSAGLARTHGYHTRNRGAGAAGVRAPRGRLRDARALFPPRRTGLSPTRCRGRGTAWSAMIAPNPRVSAADSRDSTRGIRRRPACSRHAREINPVCFPHVARSPWGPSRWPRRRRPARRCADGSMADREESRANVQPACAASASSLGTDRRSVQSRAHVRDPQLELPRLLRCSLCSSGFRLASTHNSSHRSHRRS